MPRSRAPGRRRFLKALGVAGLSSAIAPPILALAQAPTPPAGGAAAAPADTSKAAAAPAPPEIGEDARTLAEVIRRRYGKHLTPEQLEQVTTELDQRIQGGKRLRGARLANGDEPDVTFHP